MTKTQINAMISDLKKAGLALNITPWLFQERGQEKVEIRHVGLKLDTTWTEVLSVSNLVLLSFIYSKRLQTLEVFLANSTPFVMIKSFKLTGHEKVEVLLGDLRHQLKVDKQAFQHHKDQVGNLYKKIVQTVKK